ncbi:MAG: hypothetical protein MZV65_42135 [Chromatiales bacterium]|nr:hypothetical protein [Chromatiales bacterium]
MQAGTDVLFILIGAVMVLAMHAGFAFLEVGTVRAQESGQCPGEDHDRLRRLHHRLFLHRLQSWPMAIDLLRPALRCCQDRNGYELVKFFFLLTFAAAIPAIISGGIAGARPFLAATAGLVR